MTRATEVFSGTCLKVSQVVWYVPEYASGGRFKSDRNYPKATQPNKNGKSISFICTEILLVLKANLW